MATIDERLIDPEPKALIKLLDRATRAANARLKERRLNRLPEHWEKFVRQKQKHKEGYQQFRGGRGGYPAPLVKVAWWTDALNRRHWRVIGRRYEWGDEEVQKRPYIPYPLWHVYPDRFLFREIDNKAEPMVLCSCGVSGSPESVAWLGTSCGPCHDRQLEGLGPISTSASPLVLEGHTREVNHLGFTPTGQLVSGGNDGRVILWDLERGTREVLLHRPRGNVHYLAISPSNWLAVSTNSSRIMVMNLEGERTWQSAQIRNYINQVLPTSEGQFLVGTYEGVWSVDARSGEAVAKPLMEDSEYYSALLGARDSSKMILQNFEEGIFEIDLAAGSTKTLRGTSEDIDEEEDLFLDYIDDLLDEDPRAAISYDWQWLAVFGVWDDWGGVHLHHLPSGRWWPLRRPGPRCCPLAMRFTREGELIVIEGEGAVCSWNYDPVRFQGRIHLDTSPRGSFDLPTGVAWNISWDGTLVASGGNDGKIQVWDWKRLMHQK